MEPQSSTTLPIPYEQFNSWAGSVHENIVAIKSSQNKERPNLGGHLQVKFSGGSPEELSTFLEALHWAAELRNLRGKKLIAFAAENLSEAAQGWFLDWSRTHHSATFEEFEAALKKRFKDQHSSITFRKKLEKLKVERGDIKLYNYKFSALMNTNEEMSEADRYYYYYKSMPSNIQQQLLIQKVKDWRAASQLSESLLLATANEVFSDQTPMDLSAYNTEPLKCYNCGSPGHLANKCYAKGKKDLTWRKDDIKRKLPFKTKKPFKGKSKKKELMSLMQDAEEDPEEFNRLFKLYEDLSEDEFSESSDTENHFEQKKEDKQLNMFQTSSSKKKSEETGLFKPSYDHFPYTESRPSKSDNSINFLRKPYIVETSDDEDEEALKL
jgi:hypothetical protein